MKPQDPIVGRLEKAVVTLGCPPQHDRRARATAQLLESIVELLSSPADAGVPDRPPRRRPRRVSRRADAGPSGPRFPRLNAAIDAGEVEPLAAPAWLPASARSAPRPLFRRVARYAPPSGGWRVSPSRWRVPLSRWRMTPPPGSVGRAAVAIALGWVVIIATVGLVGHRADTAVPSGPDALAVDTPVDEPTPDRATTAAASTDPAVVAEDQAPRAAASEPSRRELAPPAAVVAPRAVAKATIESQPAAATVTARTAIVGTTGVARLWLTSARTDRRPAAPRSVQLPAASRSGGGAAATAISQLPAAFQGGDGAVAGMKGDGAAADALDEQWSPPGPPRTALASAAAEPVAPDPTAARLAEGEALYQRAYALQRAGDGEQAIALYRQSAVLDPGHAATHYNWGYILQQQGDPTAAMEHYRQAIALDPNHVYAHYNLAWLLQRSGHVAAAETLYRRTIELDPDHVYALYNLGSLLDRRGEADAAADLYRRVLALDPGHRWAASDLRDLLARRGAG